MSSSAVRTKNITDMHFRLVLLLWLLNYSSAQNPNCDYYKNLTVGGVAYIYNPDYPEYYKPGVQCRWIVDCPVGYNCRLDCSEITIPQTVSCTADRLMVSTSGDAQLNGAQNYCGTGTLSAVLSVNRRLSLGLVAATNSRGGRFQCSVTTQAATPPPTKCRCGERRQNRIVGGQEAGVNEFTMMAGIANRIPQIICGAVIISARHVLTAGHCVYAQSVSDYAVVVGEHDVTTGGDTSAAKGYAILKFIVHPSFNAANYDNDMAVVFINGNIQFSDLVLPVCLPFSHVNKDFAGNKVTLLGWGTLFSGGPTSNVLMKVDMDVLQQSTCRTRGAPVTDRQMCTWTRGKDACQIDSGGPLLWTDPTTGAVHAVGLISYGRQCASETPSINTRVTSFLSWIMSVTNTNQGNYCVK